jgi:hypothetical protein
MWKHGKQQAAEVRGGKEKSKLCPGATNNTNTNK